MLGMRNEVRLLLVGLMGSACFALSTTAGAAPLGRGLRGGTNGFSVRNAAPAFRMGRPIRRDLIFHQNSFFAHREHRFFVPRFAWPVYWYPNYCPDFYAGDLSYSDYGSDYDYRDNSAGPVQPQYSNATAAPAPVIIVINQGNSPSTGTSNAERANGNYGSSTVEDRQRIEVQKSDEQMGTRAGPLTFVSPPTTPAAQAAVQATPTVPQTHPGAFGKLVLVSWLNDKGKDVIFVQNTETNEVQRITSEANNDNFRIVEVHPSADPKDFEAVISNGSEQGRVKFRF
jgi:hypothetical protein